ncbi:hypothetical protein [Moraxella pluranimalium]|nr:hypothetical protein [Moraxella pluranimalium]
MAIAFAVFNGKTHTGDHGLGYHTDSDYIYIAPVWQIVAVRGAA